MALHDEINEKRTEIRTDSYSISIGEWVSLYENKEIEIHPQFQRFFRWTDEQKTNLIESILLGIPVPPIFVSQRKDGVWDVIDGMQRLSTIYQFLGVLKDENSNNIAPLRLIKTEYLPSLENKVWNDPSDHENSFTQDVRLIIKRSKLPVSIILKESGDRTRFDLFQRLNTGGTSLSSQEVRNCILVMLNKTMYEWIRELANYEPFKQCTSLSDKSIEEAYDVELVLRFLVFSFIADQEFSKIGDVGKYITKRMAEMAGDVEFDRQKYSQLFKDTFDIINSAVGDFAFKRYDVQKAKHLGGFLVSQYELVTSGVVYCLDSNRRPNGIDEKIKIIWEKSEFTDWAKSGVTAPRRLPKIIPYGRTLFMSDAINLGG